VDDERVSQDPTAENETDAEDRNDDDPSGSAPPQPVTHQRRLLLFVIAGVVLATDLLTKILAVANIEPGRPVWLIGDLVSLRLVRNPGAAFSMATGMTWLLTLVAVGVVVGVVRIGRTLRSPWWALGLGLVLGGALGNLVDRFFRAPGVMQGHVVDFVSVGWWPVFNVADSGIVCGAILLVVLTLIGLEPDGTRKGVEK
jgi:signal peptidase II